MNIQPPLVPAAELAKRSDITVPNENAEYRKARKALLVEEIELRRHVERVAALRRALPAGGEVTKTYPLQGESGPTTLRDLFGDKQSLVVYSYMFGPQRKRPCPMCTTLLSAWDGQAQHIGQRIALAVIARSPIERLVAFKKERGWRNLRFYADTSGDYTRDYVSAEDADIPALNVFTLRDGVLRHFWRDEMASETADPGQDPRGAPDLMAGLWSMLDLTPEGRGTDWYPKLDYPANT